MDQLLLSVISGVSNGAVYGLVGLGLVIIYRSTDVMNFAAGTMALGCMYLAAGGHAAGGPLALPVVAGITVCSLLRGGARGGLIPPLGTGGRVSALVGTM